VPPEDTSGRFPDVNSPTHLYVLDVSLIYIRYGFLEIPGIISSTEHVFQDFGLCTASYYFALSTHTRWNCSHPILSLGSYRIFRISMRLTPISLVTLDQVSKMDASEPSKSPFLSPNLQTPTELYRRPSLERDGKPGKRGRASKPKVKSGCITCKVSLSSYPGSADPTHNTNLT
jgi:hypothetical protein